MLKNIIMSVSMLIIIFLSVEVYHQKTKSRPPQVVHTIVEDPAPPEISPPENNIIAVLSDIAEFSTINLDFSVVEVSETVIHARDLLCLATNIYHEARGESDIGQVAVAYVTINRVNNSAFPDSICDVVYQAQYSKWWWEAKGKKVPVRWRCQFTWYCDGKSDKINYSSSAWKNSVEIALKTLLGRFDDPTGGATHYYNYHLVSPSWSKTFAQTAIIDNHSFHSMN